MSQEYKALNFIEQIVEEDLEKGYKNEDLRFRFPPEPNGYLHIGHCKAICLNFGLGEKYNAPVNLRFDDTNPSKEEKEYVDAIKRDIEWLGYTWDKECYSSDYFDTLYKWAVALIKEGKAYVDSQSSEVMAEQKGTPTSPGTNSPYRDRSVDENLELFEAMKNGEFAEGVHVLRAKIDMQAPNMLLRDPLLYRVIKKAHHRTGADWSIYPMYDWAHGESDYLEQVSHSLCSLEFKPHRPLYEWLVDNVFTDGIKPKQREFARLNLSYTIMSKRKLLKLVEDNKVSGWDDPRMPTISGLRRRGYTPASIRNFIDAVGVAKRDNIIDVSLLEFNIREDLNKIAPRVMAVLDPVKVVITNYSDTEEWLDAENNPEDASAGERKVPFSNEIYIEQEDFKEDAGSKFFRLTIGEEVRLKNAYIIKADKVIKNEDGSINEIECSYDKDSLSGSGTEASMRKVKGTLHWVSIKHAIKAEIRLYDRLFLNESPDGDKERDFMEFLNPDSLQKITSYLEPSLKDAKPGEIFQFQRMGYFNVDTDSTANALVFNRTVALRDTWAKVKENAKPQNQPKPQKAAQQMPKRQALDDIKKFGKKLGNLPDAKRLKTITEIRQLAKDVSYAELEELFNTSAKKVGTRLAVLETLKVIIDAGKADVTQSKVALFIEEMKNSGNILLEESAKNL